jgi:hypothetical protein
MEQLKDRGQNWGGQDAPLGEEHVAMDTRSEIDD